MKHKCCCNEDGCKIALDIGSNEIRLYDKSGDESLMYVDPNTIVAMIQDLRKGLIVLTEEER